MVKKESLMSRACRIFTENTGKVVTPDYYAFAAIVASEYARVNDEMSSIYRDIDSSVSGNYAKGSEDYHRHLASGFRLMSENLWQRIEFHER